MSINNISFKDSVIKIRNLVKSFNNEYVLKNVNMSLYRGENLVILGGSGVGKSVLIKIITGLIYPDKGKVTVLGKNIHNLSLKELNEVRLKMGVSFQNNALYDSMTVKENLQFSLLKHNNNKDENIYQKTIQSLKSVNLLNVIDKMPMELSGGQKKRISIARALMLNPEIMLYDEPTSGLDPKSSDTINQLINFLQKKYNKSSIIITHDLTCAKKVGNRIAIMINGNFYITGTFQQVFNNKNDNVQSFYRYNFINS